jgi:PilZ domain
MLRMSSENQRAERRVKSKGRFTVIVDGAQPILANVCDVSLSGICLETERGMETGTPVRLDADGIVADGVVRYCKVQDGSYRIGVSLLPPD